MNKVNNNRVINNLTGIRGIAALLVFLYHINSSFFSGAFIAVDIFFLLSGFLTIYQFNFEYTTNGKINLRKYYFKRILRIYPNLLLMLFTTYAIFTIVAPYQLISLKQEIIASFFGLSNYFYILNNVDYFAANLIIDPFSHLWAIAIELQFYIIAPFIYLLALNKSKNNAKVDFTKKRSKALLYKLYLVSICLMPLFYKLSHNNISIAYFGTFSRISCLILGMIIAFNYSHKDMNVEYEDVRTFYNIITGAITIFFLITCFTLSGTSSQLYQFGFIIIDLFLAFYLWLISSDYNFLSPFFCSKFVNYLGKRSYGIFLWHMPLIAIFQINKGIINSLFIFIITCLLAEMSYQFIDGGLFNFKKRKAQEFFKIIGLSLMMTLAAAMVYFLIPTNKFTSFSQEQYVDASKNLNSLSTELDKFNRSYQNPGSILQNVETNFKTYVEVLPRLQKSTNIVVGDSIMRQLALSLNPKFSKQANNTVDVDIGLQVDGLTKKLLKYQYLDSSETNLIFNVGNNGPISAAKLKSLVELYPESNIYILDLISHQDWTEKSSKNINKIAKKYDNVHLVPVKKLTHDANHDALLLEDNLHYANQTITQVKTLILETIIKDEQNES